MPQIISVAAFAALLFLSGPVRAVDQLTTPTWSGDYPIFPLQENAETSQLFPMPLCNGFRLEEATIDQMQDAMKKGKLTSQQLVVCYLQRVYQTDDYIK